MCLCKCLCVLSIRFMCFLGVFSALFVSPLFLFFFLFLRFPLEFSCFSIFLCFSLLLSQKLDKNGCTLCRAKTTQIELLREVKPRFRQQSFLKLSFHFIFVVSFLCRVPSSVRALNIEFPHKQFSRFALPTPFLLFLQFFFLFFFCF